MMDAKSIKKEVWETVLDLNSAWTVENDAKKLARIFHPKMVAVAPSERNRIEGGKKCVAAWMGFAKLCKIHWWKEFEPKIQLFGEGKFAIATYYFDMSVEMGGKEIRLRGRDMLSLVKEKGKWKVVADQFSSYPK
jgi:hypothetical protein